MSATLAPAELTRPAPASRLNRCLSRLRRRALLLGAFSGIAWAVVGLLALWASFVWLDLLWELSPRLRIVANVMAVAAALLLLVAALVRWRRRATNLALAARLDRAAGAGGQIVSGYDLDRAEFPDHYSPLTAGMARIAALRAAEVAARFSPPQVLPAKVLRPVLAAACGLVACFALVALLMPRFAQTQWLRFTDPFGDHPPYSRIQFAVLPGDAAVRYGSGVDVQVSATGAPVERVELVLREGDVEEVLPMFPEANGNWRATLTRVVQPARYFVRAARARSHQFQISVITLPQLQEVRFKITPPAYTRLPPYEGLLPPGGIAGLPGTKVEVAAKSNRPLRSGTLVFVPEKEQTEFRETLAPAASGDDTVHGTFEISRAGKFVVHVTDITGEDSPERLAATVNVLDDDRPFVRIRQPNAVSLATPSATLPVVLAGEDDYGVTRLQLYRSLNDSRPLPVALPTPEPAATRVDAEDGLPLSAYGLSPGDVIKLFARIEDNDPAQAKGSESSLVEVRIISQEQYEQMLRRREGLQVLTSKYQQAQRRLESLNAELETLKKSLQKKSNEPLSAEDREQAQRIAKRLRRDAAELAKAAEHLLPFDLDENLVQHLRRLASDLEDEARALEEQDLEKMSPEDLARLLEALEERLGLKQQQLQEEVSEPMEHLEKIYPLIEDQSKFVQLYQRQAELAQRMAALRGTDGADDPLAKGRMRDLEAEQRQLREDLENLLVEIENHAQLLPDDERLDDLRASALKFVDAARASGADQHMQDAENSLVEFAGTAAAKSAQLAADALKSLLNESEQLAGEGKQCLAFSPGLAQNLGDTIAQLLAEAGLPMPGEGAGQGAGSGFSSRRNSLRNVGLYGQHPGLEQNAGNARGTSNEQGGSGTFRGDNAAQEAAELVGARGTLEAAGSGDMPIPVRYRSRVGAYFERIVEESDVP